MELCTPLPTAVGYIGLIDDRGQVLRYLKYEWVLLSTFLLSRTHSCQPQISRNRPAYLAGEIILFIIDDWLRQQVLFTGKLQVINCYAASGTH